MELYRSFIAFQLPQKTIDYCLGIKESLIKKGFNAKWTKSQNLHITINFMGNKSKKGILKTAANIKSINTLVNKINFNVSKIKTIGSKHNILCLQLKDVNNIAADIVNNILVTSNLTSDHQTWLPHITLARIKSPTAKKLFKSFNNENLIDNAFMFSPTSVNVYISHLTTSGPIYKKVSV